MIVKKKNLRKAMDHKHGQKAEKYEHAQVQPVIEMLSTRIKPG